MCCRINDTKTKVQKNVDGKPYLTTLTFGRAEYEIPITYSAQGKSYSNIICVGLPHAGFYTEKTRRIETYTDALYADRNNGTYYLISKDFYVGAGLQQLQFGGQDLPLY